MENWLFLYVATVASQILCDADLSHSRSLLLYVSIHNFSFR